MTGAKLNEAVRQIRKLMHDLLSRIIISPDIAACAGFYVCKLKKISNTEKADDGAEVKASGSDADESEDESGSGGDADDSVPGLTAGPAKAPIAPKPRLANGASKEQGKYVALQNGKSKKPGGSSQTIYICVCQGKASVTQSCIIQIG